MQRFVEEWPRVDVRLAEAANDIELLEQIERGDLDLTFADLPLPDGPFEYVEVLRDPYVLVAPAELETPEHPTLESVAELELIGFRHCRGLNQLEATAPEPLRFVFRSDHNGTVQGMVAAGFGAAVVPRLTVDEADERVRIVELEDVPPRMIAVAWHRDRHRGPAARAFVELAQAVATDRVGSLT
jgi:DNA-binding transcriptional LysR family regulator